MGILGIPNELLLLIGENLSIKDLYHLLLACRQLSSVLIEQLRKLGLQDVGQLTALQWAAERGHAPLAELAIPSGAEIDKPDPGQSGRTPLHSAAKNNHANIIRILVMNKASISAHDSDSMTPLHYAALCEGAEATKALLEEGADMTRMNSAMLLPPLLAAEGGSVDSMMAFVDAGFDLATRGHDGQTVLHKAAGRELMMRYLLSQPETKMSVNAQDLRGRTPLHLEKNATNIKLLLRHGAAMEMVDRCGDTAGHIAAATLDLPCVKAFVDAGFDVKASRRKGWTVIHAAVFNRNPHVLEYLLRAGGRSIINAKDSEGHTALRSLLDLSWGAFVERPDAYSLLVRYGASLGREDGVSLYRLRVRARIWQLVGSLE